MFQLVFKFFFFFIQTFKLKSTIKEETLNGRYKKLAKLGTGSQGTVYKVQDLKDENKM